MKPHLRELLIVKLRESTFNVQHICSWAVTQIRIRAELVRHKIGGAIFVGPAYATGGLIQADDSYFKSSPR